MEPYEGREPYIFISYARKDAERVAPYLDALSGAGYRVWYDKGIKAGEHWTEKLVEKVEACAVFCPLFSEAFNASRFCFEETEYAYRKDKPIVPVYLEERKPDDLRPLYRLLGSRQHLRLDDCNPAQFVERLEREPAFKDCKTLPEWNKVGLIQWRLRANGFLEIAKNEDISRWYDLASIPIYQVDLLHGATAPWAPYREKIFYVGIANDINSIGDFAFKDCERLTFARISDSVTKIGDYAFYGCQSLITAFIGKRVTEIGECAFNYCENLTNAPIPDGVTRIGDKAFLCCTSLKSVRIPDSVTEIGERAFAHCERLMNVSIVNGVAVIGAFAFSYCASLTDVSIPDSVTKIGYHAFGGCENLKNVEIPAGLEIDKDTFPEHTLVIRRPAP